jgi:WD40 repeat protein
MDLHNEKIVQSFKAHNNTITGIVFDQNKDQFYSASKDNTLKVWAVGTTQRSILLETFYGHTGEINDMDYIPGGGLNVTGMNRILTCGADRQINLWKIDSQSFLQFKENDLSLFSYDCIRSLNPDIFITGTYEGTLSLWRNNKKKPVSKVLQSHGVEKKVSVKHSFFNKSSIDDEDEMSVDTNVSSSETVNLPYPILSISAIKNSDLLFSGSSDGNLNVYRYLKAEGDRNNIKAKERIELFRKVPLGQKGCINAMKVNKGNEFMILANGKDCRLGRWDTQNKAKNGISIVKLFD